MTLSWFIVGIFSYSIILNNGYSKRHGALISNIPESVFKDENLFKYQKNCKFKKFTANYYTGSACIATSTKPEIAIIGDSHAINFAYGLKTNNFDFVTLSNSGKLPLLTM